MPEKRIAPVIASQEEFEQKLPGYLNTDKILSLIFDYDGTLAPINDDPTKTTLPADVEMLLQKIAKHPRVFMAVISGRGLKDVQGRVGLQNITYGGNHGLEIELANGERQDYALPEEMRQNYTAMVQELMERVHEKNNAWVEDKRVSLTYHYRDTPDPQVVATQRQLVIDIIESYGFRANQAHDAIEAKPPVNWHKGEASLLILKDHFGPDWVSQTKVIFAGDDTTDEDAMRSLQGSGMSFRVSADPNIQTYADFRLPCQAVIRDLLKWIAGVYTLEARRK